VQVKSLDKTNAPEAVQPVCKRAFYATWCINRNLATGEPMVDLRINLMIENRAYYFNTRRLI